MRTLLTMKEQAEFLANNYRLTHIEHKWSCRGYGNSKIIDNLGDVVSRASGYGYDRFGTVVGDYIETVFQAELNKLGKRFCKTVYTKERKASKEFYGMFYNPKTGKTTLDGACGHYCMYRILNCIGFELVQVASTDNKGQNGSVFYELRPVSAYNKKYFVNRVK